MENQEGQPKCAALASIQRANEEFEKIGAKLKSKVDIAEALIIFLFGLSIGILIAALSS